MSARRLWIIACAVGMAAVLAACGQVSQPTSLLNNGVYVDAGPITYQLQVSRELNPFATEDRQYLLGLPAGTSSIGASQLWYGVFLWAKNQTNNNRTTTDKFDIVDTLGTIYRPLKLDAAINPYAWTPTALAPGATQPDPNTTAGVGPTGGELLLFKLSTTIYDNRPLTLQIRAPSGKKVWGTISLDL